MRNAVLLEGATLVVLTCIAVPLKYAAGYASLVSVMGPLHGAAFVFFIWTVANNAAGSDWSRTELVKLVFCAMFPFGAWFTHRQIQVKVAGLAGTSP